MEHGPRTSDIDDSDYDSEEDDDENEPMTGFLVLGNSIIEMARRIGRIGRPLGDGRRAEYAGLSNRERWQMHRERDGEVWMYSRGIWAGIGGD